MWATPRRPSAARSPSKCSRQGAQRNRSIFGAPAATSWQPGFLQSSTRIGFVSVLEGVHLLGHDVGRVPDSAGEQGGPLEHWGARLAVSVEREQLARRLLDEMQVPDADPGIVLLEVRVAGQDVASALHGRNLLAHHSSLSPSLMARPGVTSGAIFTPGPKTTTTVDPISKMASSAPFSTGIGLSYCLRVSARVRRALVTTSS